MARRARRSTRAACAIDAGVATHPRDSCVRRQIRVSFDARCFGAEGRNVQRDGECPSSARAVSFINQRQGNGERRTQRRTLARRADPATMPFDELFDDGQSEPEAGGRTGR
jgi:hypothetical protein